MGRLDELLNAIRRLSTQLERHDRPIVRSERRLRPTSAKTTVDLADFARLLLSVRRSREVVFGAQMFADPAWDILLDLYAAQEEGREISVSSLCIAASVPATTALRWIRLMTDEGHLERWQDLEDKRRVNVMLSEETFAKMSSLLASIAAQVSVNVTESSAVDPGQNPFVGQAPR